mmetsp:Transcript_16608/g.64867  ORF Transcript_16608/g.64867 Transcript_16608/m.64867 type:complete len:431 (+) Transcript_16608:153-1445(+)
MGEEKGNLRGLRFTITGGCGYVGMRLCQQLLRQRAEQVVLLDLGDIDEGLVMQDVREAGLWRLGDNVVFVKGDITKPADVQKAIPPGTACVFHMCSYGMSGREQLNKARVKAVNVGGSRNVLNAALTVSARAVVYTSTTNVCFDGSRQLVNEDESLPYASRFIDAYSESKCEAEQLVLGADGLDLDDSTSTFATAAIRPAGIYGEGEKRHLPRVVEMIRNGFFCFTIGLPSTRVEFVYVDNLVSAHIRLAERLLGDVPLSAHQNPAQPLAEPLPHATAAERDAVCGEAFFVSDCEPVNNFEFFRPLIVGLGYPYPTAEAPFWLMYKLAHAIEVVHAKARSIYDFQPLTRAEICKVGVTHYFKPDKARDLLGYRPFVTMEEGMGRVVKHYQAQDVPKGPTKTMLIFMIATILLMLFLAIAQAYSIYWLMFT